MIIAVLHHQQQPFLGHVATLREAGATLVEHDRRRGDALPDLRDVDAVVSLGGEQSVREIERYDYLLAEVDLLRRAVAEEVPVLGICLGGQLLAHALGATVRRASRRRIGWLDLVPTAEGAADPLISAAGGHIPGLHWNEDVFDLPPGAIELLERPGEGVEAFRAGSRAWGVQFHPDADPAGLEGWYGIPGWLAEAGVREDEARSADEAHRVRQAEAGRALFHAFAAEAGRP